MNNKMTPREDITVKFSQLCWNCQHVRNASCSWTARLKPVKDWNAVLVKNLADNRVTYAIFECPRMIPIKAGSKKHCAYCGREFISYGNPMCSYDCYKSYEKIHGTKFKIAKASDVEEDNENEAE